MEEPVHFEIGSPAGLAEAERRIANAAATGADTLDLGGLGLAEPPTDWPELPGVKTLYLGYPEAVTQKPSSERGEDETKLCNEVRTLPAALLEAVPHLERLDLAGNRLRTLPPEIGGLVALEEVDLDANQLTALPAEIGDLKALWRLDLAGNYLTVLPPEIGGLQALWRLDIEGNQLTALPPEIASLQALEELDLAANRLTTLPPEIGGLQALRRLVLDGNRLTTLPPEIGDLESLEELDLAGNRLTALPPKIGRLQALRRLVLDGNRLTALPTEIGYLKALEELSLDGNQLTALPAEIGGLQALEELLLTGNQLPESYAKAFTNDGIAALAQLLRGSRSMNIEMASKNYYQAFVGTRILRGFALGNLITPLFIYIIIINFSSIDFFKAMYEYSPFYITLIFYTMVFILIFVSYARILSGGYLAPKIWKVLAFLFMVILLIGFVMAVATLPQLLSMQELLGPLVGELVGPELKEFVGPKKMYMMFSNLIVASTLQTVFVITAMITLIIGMNAHLTFKNSEFDIIFRLKEVSRIKFSLVHFFNQPAIQKISPSTLPQIVLVLASAFFEGIAYYMIIQASEIIRGIHFWFEFANKLEFVPFFFFALVVLFAGFQIALLVSQWINAILRRISIQYMKKSREQENLWDGSILILRSFQDDQGVLAGVKKSIFSRLFDTSSSFKNLEDVIYRSLSFLGPLIALGNPDTEEGKLSAPGAVREYSSHERWQQVAREMMERSRLIVLLAHKTESLIWEVKEILASDDLLSKTIFLFPPGYTSDKDEFLDHFPNPIRDKIIKQQRSGEEIIGFRIFDAKPIILVDSRPFTDMEYYFSLRYLASKRDSGSGESLRLEPDHGSLSG